MKVLLLTDIRGLGRKMEVKDVSDGYARNFLIPKKLAVPADQKGMILKKEFEVREKQLMEKLRDLIKNLENKELIFSIKTGDQNKVFGSVSKEQIKNRLLTGGLIAKKDEVDVLLDRPLKSLGEHQVVIDFGRGLKGVIKVILKPE